jgi:Ala-tRNA(Pro) deacylase
MSEGAVMQRIRALLSRHSIVFREIHHQATYTSIESAQARGEPLAHGGKSLLLRVDQVFRLFVFSAALKLDSAAVRRRFGASNARFATAEELLELTGLVPGSVPPFGEPILPFPLYVDTSIKANPRIAFNAGSLTDSIVMDTSDYFALIRSEVFSFTRLE